MTHDNNKDSRRLFLKNLSGAALLASGLPTSAFAGGQETAALSPNDNIQVAAIGMGIMGFNNCATTVKVPGVKLVAACDLYTGHLKRAKEVYGADLQTTSRFEDILDNPAIDAVIISTTDHWHDRIAIAAMKKGKAVYCEKPMVHRINQGLPMIAAQNQTGKVCQVGSQRVSSATYLKAKELYEAGEIGQLVMAEAFWDRQSANGAWQYSIPRDASPATVDWERFTGRGPKRKFDAERFFHWRNYQEYGTGIAGDLFVHLFSGLHLITSSLGPNRIYASGGLRYWKDGRDVPDVMAGVYDYPASKTTPAFNLQLRVNFIDGGGGGEQIALIGTEGKMIVRGGSVEVVRSKLAQAPGFGAWDSYTTFDKKNQEDFAAWYATEYAGKTAKGETSRMEWKAPEGYSDHLDHHSNFYHAIRTQGKVVENAEFGFRAAAAGLASNMSLFEKKIVKWDPVRMVLV
jgi:predicted dehydrogenase